MKSETTRSFTPNIDVVFVNETSVSNIPCEDISADLVGQKAYGLCCIPHEWTLPFFVVSEELSRSYSFEHIEEKRVLVIRQWGQNILRAIDRVFTSEIEDIIVRSSGKAEGLNERGQYHSVPGKRDKFLATIETCLRLHLQDATNGCFAIPLIVQINIQTPQRKGHLSNERRFSKEKRDWVGEFETISEDSMRFELHLRNWRKKYDTTGSLPCVSTTQISETLKIPASWAYNHNERVHFEWIWDGKNVIIVQADKEYENYGSKPIEFKRIKNTVAIDYQPKILKIVDIELSRHFRKIHNVKVYQELNLPIANLYALDDQTVFHQLASGEMPAKLCEDLKYLLKRPLIVRTDIQSDDLHECQMLPRIELNDYEMAKRWLFNNCAELTERTTKRKVFLFHNFIPAAASAFAYAEPGNKTVHIEALWGLPEGLYYNAHDKFVVDTKNISVDRLFPDEFTFQKTINYKKYYVSRDDSGKWSTQLLAPPFDWKSSIAREEWVRKIAHESRKIAALENKPLSIMWFVGVQDVICHDALFPWYHEEYDYIRSRKVNTIRHKYFSDKSYVINSVSDVRKLENLSSHGDLSTVKCIRIQPMEDELLRNKNILQRIGQIAKSLNATILLEGGVLSHAYYQLLQTQASVEVLYDFEKDENKQEFNKLVRDLIPTNIQKKGETVKIAYLSGEDLLKALKHKIVEEAFEVLDTYDQDSLLNELADVNEVIDGILRYLSVDRVELERIQKKKRDKAGAFDKGIVLKETQNADTLGYASTMEPDNSLVKPELIVSHGKGYDLPISKWRDSRGLKEKTQYITKVQVPTVRDIWETDISGGAMRILFGDEYEMKLRGARKGYKMQIEVSIFRKHDFDQISLFDLINDVT